MKTDKLSLTNQRKLKMKQSSTTLSESEDEINKAPCCDSYGIVYTHYYWFRLVILTGMV